MTTGGHPGDHSCRSFGFCTSVFGHRTALSPAKIRQLQDTGIEWIEIAALQTQHLNVFDDERVGELVAAMETSPLKVWSLHTPFCGIAMDDAETREDGLRKLLQAAEVARRFGARHVVVHPGRDVPSQDRRQEVRWTREALARAVDAVDANVCLGLETMGASSIGGVAEEMLEIIAEFDPSRVGICMDTGHVNIGHDVVEYIRATAGGITTVHLHDNFGDQDAHALPGEGNIDWPGVLAVLGDVGYSGPLICEAGHPELTAPDTVREYVRRMKRFLNDAG